MAQKVRNQGRELPAPKAMLTSGGGNEAACQHDPAGMCERPAPRSQTWRTHKRWGTGTSETQPVRQGHR